MAVAVALRGLGICGCGLCSCREAQEGFFVLCCSITYVIFWPSLFIRKFRAENLHPESNQLNKDGLLGKFDDSKGITCKSKREGWQKLADSCIAKGFIIRKAKEGGYVLSGSTFWAVEKRDFKCDKCRQTVRCQFPWYPWETLLLEIF